MELAIRPGAGMGSVLATMVLVLLLYGIATIYTLTKFHDPQSLLLALEAVATVLGFLSLAV